MGFISSFTVLPALPTAAVATQVPVAQDRVSTRITRAAVSAPLSGDSVNDNKPQPNTGDPIEVHVSAQQAEETVETESAAYIAQMLSQSEELPAEKTKRAEPAAMGKYRAYSTTHAQESAHLLETEG